MNGILLDGRLLGDQTKKTINLDVNKGHPTQQKQQVRVETKQATNTKPFGKPTNKTLRRSNKENNQPGSGSLDKVRLQRIRMAFCTMVF